MYIHVYIYNYIYIHNTNNISYLNTSAKITLFRLPRLPRVWHESLTAREVHGWRWRRRSWIISGQDCQCQRRPSSIQCTSQLEASWKRWFANQGKHQDEKKKKIPKRFFLWHACFHGDKLLFVSWKVSHLCEALGMVVPGLPSMAPVLQDQHFLMVDENRAGSITKLSYAVWLYQHHWIKVLI